MSALRGRLGRAVGAAGLAVLFLAPMPPTSFAAPAPVTSRPGSGALSPDAATLSVTQVSPAIATVGDPVTITGQLTTGATSLAGARVVVRAAPAPTNRAAVSWWASTADTARGDVIAEAALPPVVATATPGAPVTVSVTVAASAVANRSPFRVIPISVQVVGSDGTPRATAHTFLLWHQRKEYERIEIATLLPATVPAEADLFDDDATLRERAWTEALGPQSPVQRLLTATEGHEVTLAVDPAIVEPYLMDMPAEATPTPLPAATSTSTSTSTPTASSPSSSSPGPAQPVTSEPGTDAETGSAASTSAVPSTPPTPPSTQPDPQQSKADAAVSSLVDTLEARLRERTVWALPYADVDIAAASGSSTPSPVTALLGRTRALAADLGRTVRTDIVWPADSLWTAAREKTYTSWWATTLGAKPAGMVVANAGITPAGPYTPSARRTGETGLPVLGIDSVLSGLLPSAHPLAPNAAVLPPTAAQATQRALAETLVIVEERSGTPRSLLLAPPRSFDADPVGLDHFLTTLEGTPWLRVVPAQSLLTVPAGGPAAEPVAAPVTPVASSTPPALLTAGRLAEIALAKDRLARIATVLADGAGFEARYSAVLDQLMSSRWRWAPGEWRSLISAVTARTDAATTAIAVVGRSVTFLAERGVIQVTVTNGLDYEITGVRLVLTPTNPRMQIVSQPDAVTIGARSQTVVNVEAAAVAVGPADLRAQLTTRDGTAIGRPAVISVQANPLDRTIYTIGGIVVGLVLVAGVLRSLLRGTSRAEQIEPPAN